MQVILTSYQRLKYLKQTVASLRQDPVELYIVDGGSDEETRDFIRKNSDGYLFFDGNPGADHLKNEGIKRFATDREFMLTSDDLLFPAGYSTLALNQYRTLNSNRLKWTFCACSMDYIENYPPRPFEMYRGVEILEVATCQVSGAIIDRAACERLGFFPVYGVTGQGEWAFSKRVRDAGLRMCYFRNPCLVHLGATKWTEYPEYSRNFERDERKWQGVAKADGE